MATTLQDTHASETSLAGKRRIRTTLDDLLMLHDVMAEQSDSLYPFVSWCTVGNFITIFFFLLRKLCLSLEVGFNIFFIHIYKQILFELSAQ